MANKSIKDAFERMWQHVVTQLGTKADKSDVNTLNTLVGDTAVSTQINNAVGKITPSSIGAAATSHGNHVPTTQTASNKTFLRNDNTWATVTPANIGAAASTHNHTKSEITDFPASLKNPNALTIQGNGTTLTNGTYDGSAAKTVNITPSAIGAAASSHGTHVSWSTTTPKANGTAAVGSETKVARGDHVHPTDTTRAAASDVTALQGLVGDTKVSTQISNAVAKVTPASIGAAASSHSHDNYLPLAGGTMTGELKVNGKDAAGGSKIVLETGKGQITNSATDTLFGYTSDTSLAVGHSSIALAFRGSGANPTYNGKDMALSSHTHSASDITSSGYLTTHPEHTSMTLIPFIHNDLAFLDKKGGSVKYYTTTSTDYTAKSLTEGSLTINNSGNMFDGSPSYSTLTANTTYTAVIDLTLHKTFAYSNQFYIDFGSNNWRAKNVSVYVMNSTTDTAYVKKGGVTNLAKGNWLLGLSHSSTNSSGTTVQGFDRLRIVLSDFNNAANRRIAQIGLVNYGSAGVTETFISRGGCSGIYGSLSPQTDSSYDLGTSSKRWKNVYADTLNGTAIPDSPKFTDTTYTSLKNPHSLTIQGNGTTLTNGTYDGSAAKTVNITPSSIGALSTSGGNVSGNVDMTGTLTVNGIKLSGYDSLGNNTTADKVLMVRPEDDHYVAYITPENICKQGITGGISSVVKDDFTASRALVSNASGKIASSTVTSTELGYLGGVTSSIQTQLNGKAASSHGTHVSYSTTAPVMDGTASAGSASTVARSDHKHPTDTSRAAASHKHSAADITSGTLEVARGGTGSTSATTNVTVTRGKDANTGSDLFGYTCEYVPYLGMCFLRIYAQPGETFSAGTAYEIGAVSSSTYHPGSMMALSYSGTKSGSAYINTSGKIVFTPYESISSSYGLRIAGFWFV